MNKKVLLKSFTPLAVIFLITTGFVLFFPSVLQSFNIDAKVLLVANIILFAAVAISFYLYSGSLKNNRPAVFLRFIYGAMFLKMMICAIAAIAYILSTGKNVNKGAIFAGVFLYFLYTFVEVAAVMKLGKENKNA
jgi:hypothetical protein